MVALKDNLSASLARRLAAELARASPSFRRRTFSAGIAAALEPLELRARVDLLADRLGAALPEPFEAAADVLRQALSSPSFDGWMVWPCGSYVADAGLDRPEVALPLLGELTPRWSSEFAVRPFIEHHPELVYEHFHRWVDHPDEHRRRLVSEGTRPRLPWAPLLRGLIADPSPNVPLLDVLADDPSSYVRRSVGNHLNDISKDRPDIALDLAGAWMGRGDRAAWTARHGLRTLVKRGDPNALALVGVDAAAPITLSDLDVDRRRLPIGAVATFRAVLTLLAAEAADAVIDYRVHYVGARGVRHPKVFKICRRRLRPGEPETITWRRRFDDVSIRRLWPGPHLVDIQVNGRVLGNVTVDLVEPVA